MSTRQGFFFISWNPFNLALLISLGYLLSYWDFGSVTYDKDTAHKANTNWETLGDTAADFQNHTRVGLQRPVGLGRN